MLDVIFEMRFESSTKASGDLLPGLLYAKLSKHYTAVDQLPFSTLPAAFRNQGDLSYQASHVLRGEHSAVQLGAKVAAVTTKRYSGWTAFKPQIETLAQALVETGMVKRFERFSFRFVNLIPTEPGQELDLLNLRFEVNGTVPPVRGMYLRYETSDPPWDTIVQVIPGSDATREGRALKGLVLDLDCINKSSGEVLMTRDRTGLFEEGHERVKQTFFSLVKPETVSAMSPEY